MLSALQMWPWHIQLGIKDLALRLANASLHLRMTPVVIFLAALPPPKFIQVQQLDLPKSSDINSNLEKKGDLKIH